MKTVLHTVKCGESLADLAAKFHTTAAAIAVRNNLKGEIFEGLKLIIEEQAAFGYTVRPFDTIDSIAKKFGVTSERLKTLNMTRPKNCRVTSRGALPSLRVSWPPCR